MPLPEVPADTSALQKYRRTGFVLALADLGIPTVRGTLYRHLVDRG